MAAWMGEDEKGRAYTIGMAANHTLSLCTYDWKYIEPKGGPKMVPWGPKIETGYSTEPQLFKKVDGDYNESENVANENPDVLGLLRILLNEVRR